jgi:hypothetical protein
MGRPAEANAKRGRRFKGGKIEPTENLGGDHPCPPSRGPHARANLPP